MDLEDLKRLADSGALTGEGEVRNALIPRWRKAMHMPELEPFLAAVQARADAADPDAAKKKKKDGKGAAAGRQSPNALHMTGINVYTPASAFLRLASGATDLLGLALLGVLVGVLVKLACGGMVEPFPAWCGCLAWFAAAALLHAGAVGLTAQSPGQRFWGVMVIKEDGGEVYLWQAYRYSLCSLMLGVLSPLMVLALPSHRGLNDLLCGTRTIRTRIIYDS